MCWARADSWQCLAASYVTLTTSASYVYTITLHENCICCKNYMYIVILNNVGEVISLHYNVDILYNMLHSSNIMTVITIRFNKLTDGVTFE